MADYTPEEETRAKRKRFRRRETLAAGEKLTDISGLTALAQKTVPNGWEAEVQVRIDIQLRRTS